MRVTVVGLGPGAGRDLTGRAREALEQAELIIGYTAYIELIREEFSHKEMRSTGMRKEVDRCRAAARGKDDVLELLPHWSMRWLRNIPPSRSRLFRALPPPAAEPLCWVPR